MKLEGQALLLMYMRVIGTSLGPMATAADLAMVADWGVEVLTFIVTSSARVVEAMISVRVV